MGEIEAGVFTDVMKYIYSGQVEFNPDTVVELMAAANQLRESFLFLFDKRPVPFVCNHLTTRFSRVCDIRYQLVLLKRRCEKYIIQAIDEDNVEVRSCL